MAAAVPLCRKCSQPINESVLKALDQTYHPACFVCTTCAKAFPDGGYLRLGDQAYCSQACIDSSLARDYCGGCNNLISVSVAVIQAMGKKFHSECFKCSHCARQITDGKFNVHMNAPFCSEACVDLHSGPKTCSACSQPIVGTKSFVSASGAWHDTCYRCSHCAMPFTDKFFPHGKLILCKPCSDRQTAATAAGPSAPHAEHATADGAHAPQSSVGSVMTVSEDETHECSGCHGVIRGTYIKALDSLTFHSERCFCCNACAKPFANLSFAYWEDKMVCNQACLDALLPRVYCAGCKSQISGADQSLEAVGARWHTTCFTCGHCRRGFDLTSLEYIELEGRAYCSDVCANAGDQASA